MSSNTTVANIELTTYLINATSDLCASHYEDEVPLSGEFVINWRKFGSKIPISIDFDFIDWILMDSINGLAWNS